MNLYMVAVLLRPTKKQAEDEEVGTIIVVEPKAVLAKDETTAAVKALKLVPKEYDGKEDRLLVKVLPFRDLTTALRTP